MKKEVSALSSLYIHFPFCLRKCLYCDFFSRPFNSYLVRDYCLALVEEVIGVRRVGTFFPDTIYIGGGTPSLLGEEGLEYIMRSLGKNLPPSPGCEITLEVNPGTVSGHFLRACRRVGVNRISLGVQSLNDRELRVLGRIHDRSQAAEAAALVRDAGFASWNVDLIYGIPGQRLADWEDTINRALDLGPDHISCYLLQLDPSVPLAEMVSRGLAALPEDDEQAELYYRGLDILAGAGYEHYEISNWALAGRHCRHNLNYWRGGDYLGLGPGAVSLREGVRWRNAGEIGDYTGRLLRGLPPLRVIEEIMDGAARFEEALIMGLRLMEGVDPWQTALSLGVSPDLIPAAVIGQAKADGLLEESCGRIRLTRRGYFLSNAVMAGLL